LFNFIYFAWDIGEHLAAVIGDPHVIFNSDSTHACLLLEHLNVETVLSFLVVQRLRYQLLREVDSGFNCDDHILLHRMCTAQVLVAHVMHI